MTVHLVSRLVNVVNILRVSNTLSALLFFAVVGLPLLAPANSGPNNRSLSRPLLDPPRKKPSFLAFAVLANALRFDKELFLECPLAIGDGIDAIDGAGGCQAVTGWV